MNGLKRLQSESQSVDCPLLAALMSVFLFIYFFPECLS